ncbi:adhesion G protein-coupled receptor L3-like [Saccoglossus kowalevskii]|uniref:Latrophilin-3-like n=1 Tax=Saccoglossus kowalevskii TaxID=10224 RepID=A0ABM0LV32_SACKO|nr:PREDICTED: latrophilin-3-like [Saccoglossus kowalevskii]
MVGAQTITCIDDSRWDKDMPYCIGTCEVPKPSTVEDYQIPNITIISGNDSYPYDSVVHLHCPIPGLRLDGVDTLTCTNKGWEPNKIAVCQDINECLEGKHDCHMLLKREECHNTIGNYECICLPDYERTADGVCNPIPIKQCPVTEGIDVCEDETEYISGFEYTWNNTNANCSSQWVPCPTGYIGYLFKECDVDGVWLEADTSRCISQEIIDITKMLENMTNVDDIVLVMEQLNEVENNFGDKMAKAEVLSIIIAKNPLVFNSTNDKKDNYINTMLQHHSNLLDLQAEWESTQHNIIEGIQQVFINIDKFGQTVYDYMLEIGRRDFNLKTNNIDYEVHFMDGDWFENKEYVILPESLNNRTTWSYIRIPTEIVQTDHEELQDKIAIIVVVYHNLSEILPTEAVGTVKSKYRTWVTSVTALVNVIKVNTPVISARIYPEDGVQTSDLKRNISLKLNHIQVGHDAECFFMKYGYSSGLWSDSGCSRIATNDTESYTICTCNHLTNFVAIMKMGLRPVPFLEAAWELCILIGAVVANTLLLISLIMLYYARLYSDRYFTIKQLGISLLMTIVTLVVGIKSQKNTSHTVLNFLKESVVKLNSDQWCTETNIIRA